MSGRRRERLVRKDLQETIVCIHERGLMIAAVQVHRIRVQQFIGQQHHHDLEAIFATVNEISIEEVLRALGTRETVLQEYCEQVRKVAMQIPCNDQLLVVLGVALQALHSRGSFEKFPSLSEDLHVVWTRGGL